MMYVNWINKDQLLAFELEHKRNALAKKGDIQALVKTYSSGNPEIINKNTPELWDKLNSQNDLEYLKTNNRTALERIKTVTKWIRSRQNIKSILNSGFGFGSLEACLLNNKNHQYIWNGIETSKKSVTKAKMMKYKNAKFSIGSVLKLPFKNESFDCVVLLEVIEHISPKNTFKVLTEQLRVLKKGGICIISTPLNEELEEMVRAGNNPNAHVRTYTRDLLIIELKISGFSIIETEELIAFKNLYTFKKIISYLLPNRWQKNNIIVLAQK